jgi:hypothetical protein
VTERVRVSGSILLTRPRKEKQKPSIRCYPLSTDPNQSLEIVSHMIETW